MPVHVRFSLPLSAIGYPTAAISRRQSVISHQPSAMRVFATPVASLLKGILLVLLSTSVATAQQDIFVPERPGQTWGTDLAAPGFLHIEAGVLMERASFTPERTDGSLAGGEVYRHTSWQLPAFMLRLGVTDRLELRLASKYMRLSWKLDPVYFYGDDAGTPMEESSNSGIDVLNIGVKTRLTEEDGVIPRSALIVSLALPGLSSSIYDIAQPAPDIAVSFSHTLAADLHLGYCAGLSWDGWTAVPVAYASTMLTLELDASMSLFAEYGMQSSYHAPVLHSADAGLVYAVSDRFVLDAWAGFGIGDPQSSSSTPAYSSIYRPDLFVGAGASWRLSALGAQ